MGPQRLVILALLGLSSCGGSISGACNVTGALGAFCVQYEESAGSASDLSSGCARSWGTGSTSADFTEGGQCSSGDVIGTCTLNENADADAKSAVIYFYGAFDADTARDDVCGTDGTFSTR